MAQCPPPPPTFFTAKFLLTNKEKRGLEENVNWKGGNVKNEKWAKDFLFFFGLSLFEITEICLGCTKMGNFTGKKALCAEKKKKKKKKKNGKSAFAPAEKYSSYASAGDPRTCAILILAWSSNWVDNGFPTIKIIVILQMHMYCGLSMKNTHENSTRILFALVSMWVVSKNLNTPHWSSMADDANISWGGIAVLGSPLYISEYLSESNNIHICTEKHHFNAKKRSGLAFSSEGGSQIYWGVINFWKEKSGGHKIFDDRNVGNHKMITDSVFILLKKTDFNTISACLGGKVYQ